MVAIASMLQSDPGMTCAKCGDALDGPEWSEPLSGHRVLQLWSCKKCGYCFAEMLSTQRNSPKQTENGRTTLQ